MHLADFIAGSVGGAFGVAVGYPLDTVKVRIQTQRHYSSVWDCVRRLFRNEGMSGFYRGMSMPVTTVSVCSSLVFGTYRNVLHRLHALRDRRAGDAHHKADIFLAGFAGGVAQVSVMSPADIVKVRLQCQTEGLQNMRSDSKLKYRGPLHCVLSIARHEGVRGLYRGSAALALRDGPSFATYFLTYNTICDLLSAHDKHAEWTVILFAGGVSGMCGWAVGTPMDVIKARLQVDGMSGPRYRGFIHCITDSVKTEGPAVLFKGLSVNCIRAFPVNMTVFATYELVVRVLRTAS
ncbi:solute carrier family 25 member 47-B [Triplophysa rosa]|uniref:Solute carrier family 25 member 47-B n=1 Tax=Triplophysa rosa TaxID=992332 RepID=A0A9W7WMR0_TRIRA|nr:solute carrier family 25 member 47-B [Triplophysa rosa]KAI7805042.1 solute carrier family 25 member 47-B [Triplophysa rosa]